MPVPPYRSLVTVLEHLAVAAIILYGCALTIALQMENRPREAHQAAGAVAESSN